MNLILEITKPDGSVVIQPVDATLSKVNAHPGEHFRLIDTATGEPPADMAAVRDGESLIIEGVPTVSAIELCDFFKRGEGTDSCVLAMPDGDLVAPTSAPVLLAQTPAADAAKKEGTAAATAAEKEAAAAAAGKDGAAAAAAGTNEGAAAAAAGTNEGAAAAAAATNPAFGASGIALGAIALVGVAAAASSGGSDDPAPGGGGTTPSNALASITDATDDVAPVTGSLSSGATTDDAAPVLNGTLSAALVTGETVEVLRDGVVVGTATVTGTTWTFADPGPLADGNYAYTAQTVDAAGMAGTPSSAFDLTVAGAVSPPPAVPAAPATAVLEDDGGAAGATVIGVRERLDAASGGNAGETGSIDVTGTVAVADAVTSVDMVLLDSNSAPVTLTVPATAVPDAAGAFTISIAPADAVLLNSGAYTAELTATNATGTSATPTVVAFDVLPISPSTVAVEGGDNTVTAADIALGTDANGLEITGTTEPGATVTMDINNASFVSVAQQTALADANGDFTVIFADTALPADGTYTLTTATTGATGLVSDFANNTGLTIDLGTSASNPGDVVIGGASTTITGLAGNETLVGDAGGNVRNGSFEFWDTMLANSFDAANPATGSFSSNGTDGADLGWQMSIGAASLDPDSIVETPTGGTQDYWNHAVGDSADGRVEFVASASGSGGLAWDTAATNAYGGGGLTQDIATAVGEVYTMVVTVDEATNAAQDTMLQVSWDGAVIAERAPDGSWSGTNVPTEGAPGTTTDWTFTMPAATANSTPVSIVAFERHYDAVNTVTGDGGDGDGLIITDVSMTAGSAAGDDTIIGGAGDDLIYGQGGADTIWGGDENGTGDTNADTYVYSMAMDNGADMIMDFDVSVDKIILTDVADADATGSIAPTLSAMSDSNITEADLVGGAGVQEVTVTDDGSGNAMLTMTAADGSAAGSVVLTGVDFATYGTVNALITGSMLQMTGDGFNTGLV